ncbi:MAG TPA: EAL domain-containing protein [Longimicrobium sp.]|jgi:EAL domain-containing protein (putative c-di-GMP-specific phosphodiesterase class I)|uniref:EAL domain-containing protein n=1 Tax=Longimicrobium sp. TaxID=2029185 RepID=UPI002ED8E44D
MFDIEQLWDSSDASATATIAAAPPAPVQAATEARFFCTVTPFYQPIVRAADLGVMAYEALARGPADSPLHPARTLFATASGLGELPALERVCWTASLLHAGRQGLFRRPGTRLFLNLSPDRIAEPTFFDFARRTVQEIGVDPSRVVVEVTEESRIRSNPEFIRALMRYRDLGFGIALDDVGTGFSDLRVLAEVRPDYLKVALELVRGVDAHTGRRHVVGSLIALGHAMGATVVVEGVETDEELEAVRGLGVDCVQGHLVGRPAAQLLEPRIMGAVAPPALRRAA